MWARGNRPDGGECGIVSPQVVRLHKCGIFQIAAENGIADIDNNGLGRLGVLRKARKD